MRIWIRIRLVTLMRMLIRIRIQVPKLMRIHADPDADLDRQYWLNLGLNKK
jgi:hypothetical protein